ncbi:MAG: alanine--tRNA ligase [Proteobacteria bacterium]|nr:alanine--tRNA ligase [Pseudomonadota bacterium]
MTGNEIRKAFIRYFESKNHKHVRSSSLVPHNDPTILFTNAGMNQFKDFFLGNQKPEYKTAVTSQKVVRAGGKHNDLENVGRTDRHHTFFEMLGNFSFGDYFKEDAIKYGWEFLTEVMGIPEEKLAVSVFEDDQEAYDIWANMGIPEKRIARLGEKENFWSMGDTGPCGPCSEIHYLLHPLEKGKNSRQSLEDDDDSYLEIWNLVFMQFNRDANGTMTPLPKPSIDTGMGLERIASVVQGKTNNYDTDLLDGLVQKIASGVGHTVGANEERDVSCRVIADHIRASTFLITDGVIPSNEGRGYVLRRIIRRAARHGKELGYQPGFFADLVDDFVPMMLETYPEIEESREYIQILLRQEERRFSSTLTQGLKILDELLENVKNSGRSTVNGAEIFRLYDTFGFPPDLASDILEDKGLDYDQKGYDEAMDEQRNRAKAAQDEKSTDLAVKKIYLELLNEGLNNQFVGYDQIEQKTKVQAILKEGSRVNFVSLGDQVEVLLEKTPFYSESGGQVGDQGEIVHGEFRIRVDDTSSPVTGLNLSRGEVVSATRDEVNIEECIVVAHVNRKERESTAGNHTATHLLQAAMRTVLGEHVKQAGSLVNPEKLRFDFSHYSPVSKEELRDIESLVNQNIQANQTVESATMSFDDAVKTGAMAIFGEKYGDEVRVITSGSSSKELCGGTHTSSTGNIGILKIISEQAIAAGVRRIEAVTGSRAVTWIQDNIQTLDNIAQRFKVPFGDIDRRMEQLDQQSKEKDKLIEQLKKEIQAAQATKVLSQVRTLGSTPTLIAKVAKEADLKGQAEVLIKEMGSGVVVLSKQPADGKISVCIVVSKDQSKQLNAGSLIKEFAPLIDGKGGGRPDFAQCGGNKPEGWDLFAVQLEKKILGS